MKLAYVSSSAVTQALRYSTMRMQAQLTDAQKEVSTGRVADVGLALGARTGQSVTLARDITRLNGLIDSNALASSRLSGTQDALGQLIERGETLRLTLSSAYAGNSTNSVVQTDAGALLSTISSVLNSSMNGDYLFAGINTDVQPIADFSDPSAANRIAFNQAFQTHFGFSQTDPAAAGIIDTDMQAFIDTVVEPMFLGAGWDAWSSATDQPIVSRIALSETAATSVSANEMGARKLAMAAVIASELLVPGLNVGSSSVIVERSLTLVSEGVAELTDLQARTGITEARVKAASERIALQVDLFEAAIGDLEGVDPYEAATRVSALTTQLETSYALTARIQQLSLLNFLT